MYSAHCKFAIHVGHVCDCLLYMLRVTPRPRVAQVLLLLLPLPSLLLLPARSPHCSARAAVEMGYRHLDCAYAYANEEVRCRCRGALPHPLCRAWGHTRTHARCLPAL